MKSFAIVIYAISLSICLPAIFLFKLRARPLESTWIKVTRRDCLFLGTAIILMAIGSSWFLNESIDEGQISQKIAAGKALSLSIYENPAEFKATVYRQAAIIPLVLALGVRILTYGLKLGRQP